MFAHTLSSLLRFSYYAALGLLVLSWCWNTGWVAAGDAYQLGPYLPWLELVFPLAGAGLWAAFFAQWALGDLRPIHMTRWFYLLLFASLLMLNVLFSVNAEGSLGWLSIWLTGSLALSLRAKELFAHRYFWGWYAAAIGLNLGLYQVYPSFIQPDLLMFGVWFAALHWWQRDADWRLRLALTWSVSVLAYVLDVSLGLQFLVALGWLMLWGIEYKNYRRKSLGPWYAALTSVGFLIGWYLLPAVDWSLSWSLPTVNLGTQASVLHGVGWGQLEWAQYLAQTHFVSPQNIVTDLWAGSRWWYEMGGLLLLWIPILWLLTVGHEQQNVGFRTFVFWGVVILAPGLWLNPGGILLGCFWFFNRQSWTQPNLPLESKPQ